MPEAARVVGDRLRGLAEEARTADTMVRAQEPEGVHDLRVALRRARSLTASFRAVLPREETARLRAEMRWAGQALSPVRDLEVVGERVLGLLDGERVELVLGAVGGRVEDHLRVEGRVAREAVERLLASPRYAAVLADLDAYAHGVDWSALTDDLARERLRRDWRRLRRRARDADRSPAGHARETALHETRKAAKRARYAAEALAPALGGRASRMAALAEQVQEALGTHRDTLLTRPLLRRWGVQAHLDGDNGFTFGRLHALEQVAGEEALEAYGAARARLERRKLRTWLT